MECNNLQVMTPIRDVRSRWGGGDGEEGDEDEEDEWGGGDDMVVLFSGPTAPSPFMEATKMVYLVAKTETCWTYRHGDVVQVVEP